MVVSFACLRDTSLIFVLVAGQDRQRRVRRNSEDNLKIIHVPEENLRPRRGSLVWISGPFKPLVGGRVGLPPGRSY